MINLVVQNIVDQTMGILKLSVKKSIVNSPLYVSQTRTSFHTILTCCFVTNVTYLRTCGDFSHYNIVQYIYTYITKKNASFTRAKIGTVISEIEEYRNARCVAASEACWRLLAFNMMPRARAVTYCNVHIQDEQNVQIHHNDTHAERVEAAREITSDLLKYFGRHQSLAISSTGL